MAGWRSLIRQERQLFAEMARVLAQVERNVPRRPSLRKMLTCPKCSRRFALPMNLGRHLSATHRRRMKAV